MARLAKKGMGKSDQQQAGTAAEAVLNVFISYAHRDKIIADAIKINSHYWHKTAREHQH